ncbi:hypothetical protein IHE55_14590 [Streptomyces pactum]|uniref:Glycoprotein n=1 Tax=Streptomyces pactum TaxID=68249 RepID=A0ABS0NL83_9ACTN|nr:DUF6049 family protein [Streptomyces pactum]MBH5335949.1 hypothetical protein [Streptomyces pactum]
MAEAAEFPGTPSAPAPARRWVRRTAALLAGVPLLAGLIHLPAAPAAQARAQAHGQQQARPTGSRTVDVAIASLTPAVVTGDGTVTVTGTVTNEGAATVRDAYVALRIGPLKNSRTAIADTARRKGYEPSLDGTEIRGTYSRSIGELRAGASRPFRLAVPTDQLNLTDAGSYQLGVSLTGQTSERPWPQVLGIERTFLPWQPSAASKKTRLTFLWPLITTTRLTARTGTDEQQSPIFRDDTLTAELSPGGRLHQLVTLGKDLPVTWVIDPDLLATVDAMTKPYEVEAEDDTTVPGKGGEVAEKWLGELERAVAGKEVVALPFADPDLASLAHRGKNVSGSLSHLQTATELASVTVESVLGVEARTDFAWPVDGAIDSSIMDVATSAGARNVIARSDSLKETGGLLYTPSAARQTGGGNTVVVADARLSTSFAGDMSKASNRTLAVQWFLAQTQMITRQAPEKQRSILVAPQRMPTARQAEAMAAALKCLSGDRWSVPQGLRQTAAATPDPAATQRLPGRKAYSRTLRGRELPTGAFDDFKKTKAALDQFEEILTARDRVVTPFGTAILRGLSTSWRGRPQAAGDFRHAVSSDLEVLTGHVKLIPKSTITLSGRSATIPVTVQNGLLQSVDGLHLRLSSSQDNRLAVGEPQPIRIEGGHSQSVKFGTTANANGRVQVTAQLYTADNRPYGAPMRFEVNVTEATQTVILVIAGGVLLLVLAGLRIYLQRKRRANSDEGNKDTPEDDGGERAGARDTATDEGEQAGDGGTTDATVPGQPSDLTPDTGSQSPEPSGSGEKVDH